MRNVSDVYCLIVVILLPFLNPRQHINCVILDECAFYCFFFLNYNVLPKTAFQIYDYVCSEFVLMDFSDVPKMVFNTIYVKLECN